MLICFPPLGQFAPAATVLVATRVVSPLAPAAPAVPVLPGAPLQTYWVFVTSLGSSTPSPLVSRPLVILFPALVQFAPGGSATTATKAVRPLVPLTPLVPLVPLVPLGPEGPELLELPRLQADRAASLSDTITTRVNFKKIVIGSRPRWGLFELCAGVPPQARVTAVSIDAHDVGIHRSGLSLDLM